MGVAQAVCGTLHQVENFLYGQQVGLLGVAGQVGALDEFHGDVGKIVFLAGIIDRHDTGMCQASGCFCLAKEAVFHGLEFIVFEFLRQGHGLDSDDAGYLRVLAEIDGAHSALAEFTFDFISAEHGFFHAAGIEYQCAAGCGVGAGENNGLFHFPGALGSIANIAERGVILLDVLVYRLGLVELAFAFIIQRKVIQ